MHYACFHLYLSYNITDSPGIAKIKLNKVVQDKPFLREALQGSIAEASLLQGDSFYGFSKDSQNSDHLQLVNAILESAKEGKFVSDGELMNLIKEYVKYNFPEKGFDSWSTGVLNIMRVLSITVKLKNHKLYNTVLPYVKAKLNGFDFDWYNYNNNNIDHVI